MRSKCCLAESTQESSIESACQHSEMNGFRIFIYDFGPIFEIRTWLDPESAKDNYHPVKHDTGLAIGTMTFRRMATKNSFLARVGGFRSVGS